jgi:hypothetical protein
MDYIDIQGGRLVLVAVLFGAICFVAGVLVGLVWG